MTMISKFDLSLYNSKSTYYAYEINYEATREEQKKIKGVHHLIVIDLSYLHWRDVCVLINHVLDFLVALKQRKNQYVTVMVLQTQKPTILAKNVLCAEGVMEFSKLCYDIMSLTGTDYVVNLVDALEEITKFAIAFYVNPMHVLLLSQGNFDPEFMQMKQNNGTNIANLPLMKYSICYVNECANLLSLSRLAQRYGVSEIYDFTTLKNKKRFINKVNRKFKHATPVPFHLMNDRYFLLHQSSVCVKEEPIFFQGESQIVVTFERPLLTHEDYDRKVYEKSSDVVLQKIHYSLAKKEFLLMRPDGAKNHLQEIGDVVLIHQLNHALTVKDSNHMINALTHGMKRTKRLNKETQMKKYNRQRKISVFDILYAIETDESSSFLWDARHVYQKVGFVVQEIEDDYAFIKPRVGFFDATLKLNEQNQNIRLHAKIKSQVIHHPTTLKKDAFMYRDYVIIENGELKITELYCKLSDPLRKWIKSLKCLKHEFQWDNQVISVIDLKLLLVTPEFLAQTSPEDIVKKLIQIESCKCEQWALKQALKTYKAYPLSVSEQNYRINEVGEYRPLECIVQKNNATLVKNEMYCRWTLHRFKTKLNKEQAIKHIMRKENEDDVTYYHRLCSSLKQSQKQKKKLEKDVHFTRIAVSLLKIDFFVFDTDKQITKVKTESQLELPLIIGNHARERISKQYEHAIKEITYQGYIYLT